MRETGYRQFCPVSRAAEVIAERWTPLVVRELLCGSVRFNDLQRGVPRMSSALLSRRLRELEYAGVVERRSVGRSREYHLTAAGRDLLPVLEGMGNWAQRWLRYDLIADKNLDPDLLMWEVRRRVAPSDMGAGRRFVVGFQYQGVPINRRRYWLVFEKGEIDLCFKDPGFQVDLTVSCHIRTMVEIWLGHDTVADAIRHERLSFDGARRDISAFRSWLLLSVFAPAGRQAPGVPAKAA
jgi:DNA-binding HxlR family transcriptional regulator